MVATDSAMEASADWRTCCTLALASLSEVTTPCAAVTAACAAEASDGEAW